MYLLYFLSWTERGTLLYFLFSRKDRMIRALLIREVSSDGLELRCANYCPIYRLDGRVSQNYHLGVFKSAFFFLFGYFSIDVSPSSLNFYFKIYFETRFGFSKFLNKILDLNSILKPKLYTTKFNTRPENFNLEIT